MLGMKVKLKILSFWRSKKYKPQTYMVRFKFFSNFKHLRKKIFEKKFILSDLKLKLYCNLL